MKKTKKMKWWYSFFALLLMVATIGVLRIPASAADTVKIDKTNFPDPVFRNFVSEKFDTNKDGQLSSAEIKAATDLFMGSVNTLTSVKGVEYLTNLTNFSFINSKVTSMDLSKNTKLNVILCTGNKLTSLDVSKNKMLYFIDISDNNLTSLDVSKNTNLQYLYCGNNKLTSLDVSKNTQLAGLICNGNKLKSIDVSKNTELVYLYCHDNQISSLDLSKNTKLSNLYCSDNELSILDLSKNTELYTLTLNNNKISSLDLTNNPQVSQLSVPGNPISKLNISLQSELVRAYKKGKKIPGPQDAPDLYKYGSPDAFFLYDSSTMNGKYVTNEYSSYSYLIYGKDTKISTELKPLDITLSNVSSGVKITWKAIGAAQKYRVFRKTGSGSWVKLTTTTSASFVDKTAVYGKTYSYAVRAMNSSGAFISEIGDGKAITYYAAAPKVTLDNGTMGVNINWKTMTGAAKYRIFVKNSSGAWAKLATIKEGTTYTDTTAKVGKSYTYSVVGMDSAGHLMNDYGTGITITREKPVMSFTLKSVAAGVKISWKAEDGAGKYRVYRKNSDGSWATLATIKDGSLFYRDATAVDGKTYTYAVAALSAGGTALTDMGDGQKIKYVKPVSKAEVVENEVTDMDGNVIVYTISGDEITEDYVEIVTEESKEKSEDISEDTEEVSKEEGDISEVTEDEEGTSEEEAIFEDEEETFEEEVISEDEEETSEEDVISEDEEGTSKDEAISEDNEEESGEDVIAEETVNSEITEEVQE